MASYEGLVRVWHGIFLDVMMYTVMYHRLQICFFPIFCYSYIYELFFFSHFFRGSEVVEQFNRRLYSRSLCIYFRFYWCVVELVGSYMSVSDSQYRAKIRLLLWEYLHG